MRADLAVERLQLQDLTRRREDGERVVKNIPWQAVTYPGGISGLEPVDFCPGLGYGNGLTAAASDKEITGVISQRLDTLFVDTGTAGDVLLPQG